MAISYPLGRVCLSSGAMRETFVTPPTRLGINVRIEKFTSPHIYFYVIYLEVGCSDRNALKPRN
jgi:hypothetical protein